MSQPAKKTTRKSQQGFTDAEQAAMKERAKELRAEERMNKNRAAGESAVLEAIADMPEADRVLAQRIHELITTHAPQLMPKTWYGMPAYAEDGKIVCFFQAAHKFEARYATLGFNDAAQLDDGAMWAVAFGLTEITPAAEDQIIALIKRAVGEK